MGCRPDAQYVLSFPRSFIKMLNSTETFGQSVRMGAEDRVSVIWSDRGSQNRLRTIPACWSTEHMWSRQSVCKHFERKAVISKNQHGFLKNKPCRTHLISSFDRVTSLVDEGNTVDVAYLDFRKAFDKVPQDILASNLDWTKVIPACLPQLLYNKFSHHQS